MGQRVYSTGGLVEGLRERFGRLIGGRWQPPPAPCSTYLEPLFTQHVDPKRVGVAFEVGSRDALDAVAIRDFYEPDRVVCMECNPEALQICRSTLAAEPNIQLVEKAAWHEAGKIPFYPVVASRTGDVEGRNIGASSCYRESGAYAFREQYDQTEIEVDAIRLDELCWTEGIDKIDLLCLDVQGAALSVLQGLGDMLCDTSYVLTELEVMEVYRGQSLLPDVAAHLHEYGFRLVTLRMEFPEFGNFLFIHQNANG